MRIVLAAPWFRSLAHLWRDALVSQGHQVLIIARPFHMEQAPTRHDEYLFADGAASLRGWREYRTVRRMVADFRPDIVLSDHHWDPRFQRLAPGCPLVIMIHDADPHDADHEVSTPYRQLYASQLRRAAAVIVFSQDVAAKLRSRLGTTPIHEVVLPSEMPDSLVPAFVLADQRRDFLLFGRMHPYKNVDTVFAAWQRHVDSGEYAGDRLIVWGEGEVGAVLPDRAERRDERYQFRDLAEVLAAAKGSFSFYRKASQSGTQLLAMQVGCMPMSSDAGAMPQYQPPQLPCLPVHDVAGLADYIARLTDPVAAAELGRDAQLRYIQRYSASVSAQAVATALAAVLARTVRASG